MARSENGLRVCSVTCAPEEPVFAAPRRQAGGTDYGVATGKWLTAVEPSAPHHQSRTTRGEVTSCVSFLSLAVVLTVGSMASLAADPAPRADHGWTSPWMPSGETAKKEHLVAQPKIKVVGDMALESTGPIGFYRRFPDVKSGVLKIEFRIRFRFPTVEVNHPHSSVAKVYLVNKDKKHALAWRWHTPYAWPRAGGNTLPRFYVGKTGGDYTNFVIEPHRWYKVATVSNLDDHTWQFWVDDVKYDGRKYQNRADMRMKNMDKVNALLISSRSGGIWFDAFRIWHNGKLIATCDVNTADGYVPSKSVIDLPANPKEI